MTPEAGIIGGLVLIGIIFFVGREIMLWYFKINQHIYNQIEQIRISKSIEESLRQITKSLQNGAE